MIMSADLPAKCGIDICTIPHRLMGGQSRQHSPEKESRQVMHRIESDYPEATVLVDKICWFRPLIVWSNPQDVYLV